MLKTLAVSGYRSLRDLVIPLDRLNLVTGPNGSGKSNLYRALRLLAETAQGHVIPSLAREGGLHAFLNHFPDAHGSHPSALDAVALVIRNLLVASDGSVVPSLITYEVQIRRFDAAGRTGRSRVFQFELSRQQQLAATQTGGLRALDEYSPVYLPVGGNDFSFAAPPTTNTGKEPVLVPLRQRCSTCHTRTLEHLITFSMHTVPGREVPAVVRLNASEHAHPRDVAARKMTLESWKSLLQHWSASR